MLQKLRRTVQEDGLRATLLGVALIFVVINLVLLPYLWGGRSLQDSIDHVSSLYPAGSRPTAVWRYGTLQVLDPGAPAWLLEPEFAAEHNIIVGQKEPPIWNPYVSYGVPLAADAQSQPYSPFAWIPIFWSSAEAYNIYIALRIFAGGVFAFLFLRLFMRTIPAVGGGIAFMFSGYYWIYLTMPHLSVEVLLPAMLYSLELVMRRHKFLSTGVLALVVACLVLGGMPESTALAFVFGAFYFIARTLFTPSLRHQWKTFTPHVLLGTVAGIGISAALLIPLLEYIPLSFNIHVGSNLGLNSEPLTWSALAGYLAPLYPRSVASFSENGYAAKGFFECSVLFFAIAGFSSAFYDLIKRRADNSTPVILILGLCAAAFTGKRFGAFFINWIGSLPILRLVVFYKYEEAIIGCCVALLAGFGISRLCEKRVTAGSLWLAALIPLAILTGAVMGTRQAALHPTASLAYYVFAFTIALFFLALAAGSAAAAYSGKLKYSAFALTALSLVLLEPLASYIVPLFYVVNEPPPQSASPLLGAPYVGYLKTHLTDNERLYGSGGLLYPLWGEAFGLQDVRGMNALYPNRYLPFIRAFMPVNPFGGDWDRGADVTSPESRRLFALSSVRYVVNPTDLSRLPNFRRIGAYRETYEDANGVRIFAFRSPLPRLAIFHRVVHVRDGTGALRELTSSRFDPYSEVVVEGIDPSFSALAQNPRNQVSAGKIQEYTATFVKASVTTHSTALVVLNDTNFPGWQASIDGRSAPIYAANYLFRGIVVPQGTHVLAYRYAPRSFAVGGLISLVSLCGVGWMCFAGLVQDRRSKNASV